MGIVLEFPGDVTMRRGGTVMRGDLATVLILPVVRIERSGEESHADEGPGAGDGSGGGARQRRRG